MYEAKNFCVAADNENISNEKSAQRDANTVTHCKHKRWL